MDKPCRFPPAHRASRSLPSGGSRSSSSSSDLRSHEHAHQGQQRLTCEDAGSWTHACLSAITRFCSSTPHFRVQAPGQLRNPGQGDDRLLAAAATSIRSVSAAAGLRLLREEGLLLEANYQRERRQLAARRKAAFAVEPTAPNQVWQLDFTDFETTTGGPGASRAAGTTDRSTTSWAGTSRESARRRRPRRARPRRGRTLAGRPLGERAERDVDGNVLPLVTIVTDNGGPFRFEAFIATRPELRHVHTRVRPPG